MFAQQLDEFLMDLPTHGEKFAAVQKLTMDFKWFAQDVVVQEKKRYEKERAQQLRKEWSERAQLSSSANASSARQFGASHSGALAARKFEEVKDLRQHEQEMDIWELFRLMLEIEKMQIYTPGDWQQKKCDKYAVLDEPHRYISEAKIWERFLVDDDLARERSALKKWLEQTADHQDNDLEGIMEELEAKSGAGKGLWTQGWMHTREKIKGEKRIRSWPSGSQSVQPQIKITAGNDMLVTQLDPDAPSRQHHALEKPDKYYEKAMWVAIWEMLRRGKSRKAIQDWCEQRNEGWRSAILSSSPEETDAASTFAWRRMCHLASESDCSNEYEAAVYGLLGGNMAAAQKVCRTIDDHLWVYYSVMLVRQFDAYIQQNFPNKFTYIAGSYTLSNDIRDSDKAKEEIDALIAQLRQGRTKEESLRPLKIIQGYLMAKEVESMIETVGMAVSDLDAMRGEAEQTIVRLRPAPDSLLPEAHIVTDANALRIVTHMFIILRSMDSQYGVDASLAAENVVAAYIQALRAAGKRDVTPLYATQISRPRQDLTLASVLQDISQVKEQQHMLDLLGKYDLNVIAILISQLRMALDVNLGEAQTVKNPLKILEDCDVSNIHPGQRITEDFFLEDLDGSDLAIVRSLQWFQLLQGHWDITFSCLSLALRKCLVAGRFACAVEIVRNFPYAKISKEKAFHVLNRPVNVMEPDPNPPRIDSENEDEQAEALKLDLMKKQSRTYYELEQLIHAIDSLNIWVIHERPYTVNTHTTIPAPNAMKRAKVDMDEAMQPLLSGILRNPIDEEEAADLLQIRNTYLPEVIIAYNTALYTAGPTISRESYIESMDLSVAVASESSGLTECFVQAGRMRELVSSFAQTSKMMLIMKASGGPRKTAKKEKAGKELGIWEIGPGNSNLSISALGSGIP